MVCLRNISINTLHKGDHDDDDDDDNNNNNNCNDAIFLIKICTFMYFREEVNEAEN